MEVTLVGTPRERMVLPGSMVSATVPLGGVDWSQEVALIIDMGERRTGGYAVEVVGVTTTGGAQIHLDLRVVQPSPGDFVTQVLTHPYSVAKVSRGAFSSGPVTVVARNQHGVEVIRQVVSL